MAAISTTLLRPATWWMERLRVPMKLVIMGCMLLCPLVLITAQSVMKLQAERLTTQSERQGLATLRRISEVIAGVQQHRAFTSQRQSGDATAEAALTNTRQSLRDALQRLDQQRAELGLSDTDARWQGIKDGVSALAEGKHATQRQQAMNEHSAQIEQLRVLALEVGEATRLLLDPQADTALLAEVIGQRILPWSEQVGRAASQGVALLARGETSAADRAALLGRADALNDQLGDLKLHDASLQRANVERPPAWDAAVKATLAFEARIRELFSAQTLDTPPADFLTQAQQTWTAVGALDAALADELDQRLALRERRLQHSLMIELGVTVVGLALMSYLATAFFRTFTSALRTLQGGVSATAEGDLAAKVELSGKDELAEIGRAVDGMASRLSAMVADIRSSAVRVGQAGQQVAHSSDALSQRTHAQADSLRQTTATVAELSAAVASNAEAAQALDQLTDDLRERAERGGQAMRDTVNSMSELESGSRRVSEIIGVIDGIAFQTNILALNAAVEAARAGDAGRGFAVVASEVRQLALRSSTASAEIRQLIAQSTSQVNTSVGRIQQVGATLDAVVNGVRDVSARLRGIAQASAQQSAGLEEVSRSVGNLDELTKQNAEMVSQSSAAATDLVERAAALSGAVAAIRLRQGSADEAAALVTRALELIRQRGLEAAAQVFRDPQGGFLDRDLYIFVTDRDGRYHVHGAKPAMEGRRVHELPGIDGDRFARESWAATQGNHWVEYDIVNPETGVVQPKASYVFALDDRRLVGCGIYRQVSADSSLARRAAA